MKLSSFRELFTTGMNKDLGQSRLASAADRLCKAEKHFELLLLSLAAIFLVLHFVHLTADLPVKIGWLGPTNASGDLYTDEGWASAGATAAILRGNWYVPGDFNLAVDAPLWPAILLLAFKVFGFSMVVARAVAASFFLGTVVLIYFFVKRLESGITAAIVVLLLASNFLGFAYGRFATMEVVWVFFLTASLLLAQVATTSHRLLLSFAAGILLGLAILAKLTAAFGIAPLLAVFYLGSVRMRQVLQQLLLAVAGTMAMVFPIKLIATHRYRVDHLFYIQVNVVGRSMPNMVVWIKHLAKILYSLQAVDLILYLAFLLALCLHFWFKSLSSKTRPLFTIALIWLTCNVAALSSVRYFPYRYSFSCLFPIVILVVSLARSALKQPKPFGTTIFCLIAASIVLNSTESLSYILKPRYSYRDASLAIQERISLDNVSSPQLLGNSSSTIAMFTRVPALNDVLGTTSVAERIARYHPDHYVSLGQVSPEMDAQFGAAQVHLVPEMTRDVMGDYLALQPLHLYRLEPGR